MNPEAAAGPELRDIHLPPPPGWWPPAPGWWLVAAVVIGLLAWFALRLRSRALQRRQKRRVLRELEREIAPARNDPSALAATLSAFLRRLTRIGHGEAAALAGEHWLAQLDRCAGSEEFTRGVGRVLIDAPYRRSADYDGAALIALVRRCVQRMLETERARA